MCRLLLALATATGCAGHDATTAPAGPSFSNATCSVAGTLQLSSGQTARVDCSNGGTTVTLAGNGASYLVVAQFAVDQVPDALIPYHLSSGTGISASRSAFPASVSPSLTALPQATRPRGAQLAFDRMLRARARRNVTSGQWHPSVSRTKVAQTSTAAAAPLSLGSARAFHVLANSTGTAFSTVGARLSYAGNAVLLYVDTLAPANGFTPAQLQAFGQLFDQTLYPIDTAAFGPPSDIDHNGRVIMLMSPAVNALTSASTCQTQGFVAGFFS